MTLARIGKSWAAFQSVANLDNYDNLVALADRIIDSGKAGPGGELESLFMLLTDLIQAHDARHYRVPDAEPEDVLRFLMQQHNLNQSDLPEVGNQSVVSQVLAGKRELNVRQIARLRRRFGVGADAFIPSGDPPARVVD